MAITRTIWKNSFSIDNIPNWPCPTCMSGILGGNKSDIKTFESKTSQNARLLEEWEADWVSGYFTGTLICNNDKCKETIVVSGKMNVSEEHQYDELYEGWTFSYSEDLTPKLFLPTLKIFQTHKDIPKDICKAIEESFKLFWLDESSCGNKIRTVIELIMDEQKVAKTYVERGKRKGYSLHRRIELFKTKKTAEGDLLMAIKWIGNSGSHINEKLTKDDTLDAYEILEHVTTRLYEKDSYRIRRLSSSINKKKKPLSKTKIKTGIRGKKKNKLKSLLASRQIESAMDATQLLDTDISNRA